VDEVTASRVIEHNRRLHEAPGYAESYDRACGIVAHPWERRVFERDAALIAAVLGGPPEGKRVLDVGCGTGSLALLFLQRGYRVVGLDLSGRMLAQLQAKAAEAGLAGLLSTQQATADDYLAACPEAFDAILFSAILHHLPDYLRTLALAAEHTRPGGVIYIIHEPSQARRVGLVARALERLDSSLAELPGFLRRQWRDVKTHGLFASLRAKLRRRLRPGPQPGSGAPGTAAQPPSAVDWALVDYHAKHGGCDEEAIADTLRRAGFSVDLRRYDSKRHRIFHWLAIALRTKRMIRVLATREGGRTADAGTR